MKTNLYVCSAINKELISKIISADSYESAKSQFYSEYQIYPEIIYGPFAKLNKSENISGIKFSGVSKKGIYKDWHVNALLLTNPKNNVYLLFDKRIDGKKMTKPTGTFVVHLDELRIING